MDARLIADATGELNLVVQSCVSPAAGARRKVLATIEKLKNKLPRELVYCTSAVIGIKLDKTINELRAKRVTLTVRDATWLIQREHDSHRRSKICDDYANAVLSPILKELDPNRLYNAVLTDQEERVAVHYLEAVNLDRKRGSNITHGVFDALVFYALRDSDPEKKGYHAGAITETVRSMFPEKHAPRVGELVAARLAQLEKRGIIHNNTKVGGWVIADPFRGKLAANISATKERDVEFRGKLRDAIVEIAEEKEIEGEYPVDKLIQLGHDCVFWYMREQGRMFADPSHHQLTIYNAERLVKRYMVEHPDPKIAKTSDEEIVYDLLPAALNRTLNSSEEETQRYLRAKADLFMIHAFMEVTPDIQRACHKILGGEILYLDTSLLIRCLAELYSPTSTRPVLRTLQAAVSLGCQLRTWRMYVEELIAHLKGPVLLEWSNQLQTLSPEVLESAFRAVPTLIEVFYRWTRLHGGTMEEAVQQVIGRIDETENTIEFLKEELGVTTETIPSEVDNTHELWEKIFTTWCLGKRNVKTMPQDKFELLVRHDVLAYLTILNQRQKNKAIGPNYGHKVALLTFDRMPQRIARSLSPKSISEYDIVMSLEYLMNVVAAVAYTGTAQLPEEALPATLILGETDIIPNELRAIFRKAWDPNEKRYIRERKLREIVHQLKFSVGDNEGIDPAGKLEITLDEQF